MERDREMGTNRKTAFFPFKVFPTFLAPSQDKLAPQLTAGLQNLLQLFKATRVTLFTANDLCICHHPTTPSLLLKTPCAQCSLFSQHLLTQQSMDAHVESNGCPCPSGLSVSTGKDCNLNPSPSQSNINSGVLLKAKSKHSA